ncbi:MAG TPA: DUF1501 domain-containing protein [Planctomycetia bacterium]|nr:DUF1501 domain-containing protein [Planctomycetia bacterium]
MSIDRTGGAPEFGLTRREMLLKGGAGFGALPLASLLGGDATGGVGPGAGKAKAVIFLFMEGGPSHLDTFDPKPKLNELAGKPLPASFGKVILAMGEANAPLLASKRKWSRHGKSGLPVSDWYPEVAKHADDLCVLRSCWADGINHSTGVCQMNTGATRAGRPSLGSWVSYGMGTVNRNLPAFVVLSDSNATVVNGPRNWSAGFMPAVHQGVQLAGEGPPISNLNAPKGVTRESQRAELDLLAEMNRRHSAGRIPNSELDARIAAYELAFRMQAEAPDAVDLTKESEATRRLYGMDVKETATFGRMCLLARRFVERGVRFVQLYSGAGSKWDAHSNIEKNHSELCRGTDKPIAGLLADLKAHGLLDSTLVIWGGEFGRTPMSEKGNGRDHNPTGFTMWLAGGGVKGGQALGATDDLGLRAVEDRLHVHDFHATILHQMGIDHMGLIYRHLGRPERPTLNEGEVFRKALA